MATITQLFQHGSRKIVDRGFDLVLAWYEATKFTPTDLRFL